MSRVIKPLVLVVALLGAAYVARMALFLAADDSAMCTASNYMVEAGSI